MLHILDKLLDALTAHLEHKLVGKRAPVILTIRSPLPIHILIIEMHTVNFRGILSVGLLDERLVGKDHALDRLARSLETTATTTSIIIDLVVVG